MIVREFLRTRADGAYFTYVKIDEVIEERGVSHE